MYVKKIRKKKLYVHLVQILIKIIFSSQNGTDDLKDNSDDTDEDEPLTTKTKFSKHVKEEKKEKIIVEENLQLISQDWSLLSHIVPSREDS